MSFSLVAQKNEIKLRVKYQHQFGINKNGKDLIRYFNEDDLDAVIGFSISLSKNILKKERVQVQLGAGYMRTVVLPRILVRTCEEGEFCLRVGVLEDNYSVDMLTIPFISHFKILGGLGLDINMSTQFRFHQSTSNELNPKWLFSFESINITPAITYEIQRLKFGMGYQIFNFIKRDPIYEIGGDNLLMYPDYYNQDFELKNIPTISCFIEKTF